MGVHDASQQSIIQASLKDDFYLQLFRGQLSNIFQQLFGEFQYTTLALFNLRSHLPKKSQTKTKVSWGGKGLVQS